jgi:glycosyltransferase involved in cell wall biosynthesis
MSWYQISVFDDCSTDDSAEVLRGWVESTVVERLGRSPPINVVMGSGAVNAGAGAARNGAVRQSGGEVLVIQVKLVVPPSKSFIPSHPK